VSNTGPAEPMVHRQAVRPTMTAVCVCVCVCVCVFVLGGRKRLGSGDDEGLSEEYMSEQH
jgi:hypothetical protein